MSNIFSQGQTFFVNLAKLLQKYVGGVGTPKLDYSWLIILFFVFILFLVGFSLGRSRMMLSLLSLYVASFLENHFVYFNNVVLIFKKTPQYVIHIGIFLIFYLLVLLLLNRSFLKHRLTLKESSIFSTVLIAVLEIGFMASLFFSYLSVSSLAGLPKNLVEVFSAKNTLFWWALAPVAVLIFLKKEKKFTP